MAGAFAIVETRVSLDPLRAFDQPVERPGMAVIVHGALGARLADGGVDDEVMIEILIKQEGLPPASTATAWSAR